MSSNEDVEDELERRRCRQLLPHNQFVTAAAHGEIGYMKALIESHGDGLVEATYDEKVLERGECYYDEDRRHQVGRRYYLAKGWTALLAATTCQELEAVKYLVETCHANVEARDKEQFTPLILACSFGFLEIAQYLVVTGNANVEARNEGGGTPLHCATIEGHLSIIQFLLEQAGADIAAKTNGGQTALSLMPNQNRDEIAEYLVSKMRGSIDIEALDANHCTLLNWACWHDYDAMAIQLVNVCQANVHTVDCDGKTPLHHANTLQLFKCLVEKGRANVHAVDSNGDTVLHLHFESLDTLDYLLGQPGANVDVPNKDGETVLHLASKRGFYDYLVRYLVENFDASVHVQDKKGWTALHHACSERFLGAALILLKAGARVETTDRAGRTALHLACAAGARANVSFTRSWCLIYALLEYYCTDDDEDIHM